MKKSKDNFGAELRKKIVIKDVIGSEGTLMY